MSTFKGPVKELPNVSIDRFCDENKNSSCFFLSHCHSDHMEGLDRTFIDFLLEKEDYYLYCTPISRLILLNMFKPRDWSEKILELNKTTTIEVPASPQVPHSYRLTVNTIPAGHCPGSVMFLFETNQETILYTGDIKIAKGDIAKFKQLHSHGHVKEIHKMYFDSTFFSENFWEFPTREECLKDAVSVMGNWFKENPKNIVYIKTSANYGSEYLFIRLADKFKCKIHVPDRISNVYWNVPEIGIALTTNHSETKIHAGYDEPNYSCVASCDQSNILLVRPTAQRFRWKRGQPKPVTCSVEDTRKGKVVRICYSAHSSCSELVDLITYLKPKEIEACTGVVFTSEEAKLEYLERVKRSYTKNLNSKKGMDTGIIKLSSIFTAKESKLKIRISPSKKIKVHHDLLDSPPLMS